MTPTSLSGFSSLSSSSSTLSAAPSTSRIPRRSGSIMNNCNKARTTCSPLMMCTGASLSLSMHVWLWMLSFHVSILTRGNKKILTEWLMRHPSTSAATDINCKTRSSRTNFHISWVNPRTHTYKNLWNIPAAAQNSCSKWHQHFSIPQSHGVAEDPQGAGTPTPAGASHLQQKAVSSSVARKVSWSSANTLVSHTQILAAYWN